MGGGLLFVTQRLGLNQIIRMMLCIDTLFKHPLPTQALGYTGKEPQMVEIRTHVY